MGFTIMRILPARLTRPVWMYLEALRKGRGVLTSFSWVETRVSTLKRMMRTTPVP